MRRPPLLLILLSVLLLALGTTGGAVMSVFRPQIREYSTERIFAAREAHNLSGSPEYDAEVVQNIVFTIEAGLSFFHTHGEGMGVVLLFAATAVAALVGRRWLRSLLHGLLGLSFVFPIGYLAYSAFTLEYGKDAGIALAEQLFLIPSGSSAILGLALLVGAMGFLLVNGRIRRAISAAGEPTVPAGAREAFVGWRRPPRPVVLAAALLIALAEVGGASMARFKPEITAFATGWMLDHPAVHGLVGVEDVDAEVLDEALVKLDGGLRLFHLHGEGMGLVIVAVTLVISTLVRGARLRKIFHILLTIGGFGFPLGFLLFSALIPLVGTGPARNISAVLVLVPCGAMILLALWALTLLLAWNLATRAPRPRESPPAEAGEAVSLPPLPVMAAAMLLLVFAEIGGGAMVKFKLPLDRAHREEIEARPGVHGLVGVRAVDGPVIDDLLLRADFAARLFHLHGEGMGLIIFAGGLVVRNFLASPALSRALYAMLGVGGFLYPFGYLAWSAMIPLVGLERSKELAEDFVWIPFGGAALVAVGMISLAVGRDLYTRWRSRTRTG